MTGDTKHYSGGCQCGAVRFCVPAPLGEATVCHCRMCQKATGGAFGLFVRVDRDGLVWTRGEPSRFASSNVARRGFCATCGTPLTWEFEEGIDLAIAAFDKAHEINPVIELCRNARLPGIDALGSLPQRTPADDSEYADFMSGVKSNQHPDHDTQSWTVKS